MDSQQIATDVLSLTASRVVGWQDSSRRDMARRVNEYTARLVAERPDRFGNFATLPLPDLEGALLELVHAFDTLKADGMVLLSNYVEADVGGRPRGSELCQLLANPLGVANLWNRSGSGCVGARFIGLDPRVQKPRVVYLLRLRPSLTRVQRALSLRGASGRPLEDHPTSCFLTARRRSPAGR